MNNGNQRQNRRNKSRKHSATSRGQHQTSRTSSSRDEKNNYQDKSETREYNKGYRAGKEADLTKAVATPTNEFSWYNKHPDLIAQAAKFAFGYPAGDTLPEDKLLPKSDFPKSLDALTERYRMCGSQTFPGIMSIGIAPTIGISTDNNSPINIASLANYDFVRKANAGSRNYDWPDLTLMYMAMDSVYMYWNFLERIYGTMMMFDPQNRYTPRALVEAQGVDYDDISDNLADFRLKLNIAASQVSSIAVPKEMSFIIRHSWLMQHVFYDAESPKAQYYIFVPSWVYKYSERSSDKGGELLPVPVLQGRTYNDKGRCQNPLKYKDLFKILNDLITAVLTSQDIGTMSGDIMKAYGNNLFMLAHVPETYQTGYYYSPVVLSQIENLLVVPVDTDFSEEKYKIAQDPDTNLLVWNPRITDPDMYGTEAIILNLHVANPDAQDITEASRLSATLKRDGDQYIFTAVGSEFVTGLYIHTICPVPKTISAGSPWWYAYDTVASGELDPLALRSMYINPHDVIDINSSMSSTDVNGAIAYIARLCFVSMFDWHPIFRTFYRKNVSGGAFPYVGDIDNFAVVDSFNLQNLHLACLMSEFDVPMSSTTT